MSDIAPPFLPDNFFPEDVFSIFVHQDYDDLEGAKLHPSELLAADAFKNTDRKNSFLIGRKAAHLALMKIGVFAPVLRGNFDEPLWPEGVVGSISHSGKFAICTVTKSKSISGIGIDLECGKNGFNPKIEKRVCTAGEIENLPTDKEERRAQLLKIFSAKEAYYKAVYPTLKKVLGFRDVELVWNRDEFEGKIVNPKIGKEKPAQGKVGQGSCLISICYERD